MESLIWNPEYECLPREELRELQKKRLQWSLKWAYERVPFYRRRFDELKIRPEDIKDFEDLKLLPFTTKDDLRENYPYGLFALNMEEIVRIHGSSGTTGKPVVVGYSRGDLSTWSELVARIATAGGVQPEDICQIAFGYGLFTGGFGLHQGLERIGATVIPASAGMTERQVQIMVDFKTTVLVCTPSYALHIAEVGEQMGVDFRKLPLRVGLFGAEPWSENMRAEIEKRLGIVATDNYGLTEVIGPGVAGECLHKQGLHINEDHFLVEVVDPESGEPLPPGEVGELVFTSLTKEAFPIIRFRTRDLSVITEEACPCGRTLARMSRVKGRTDDMLIIRGVNVFPSQIEQVLIEVEGVEPHYQIIVEREGALDSLEIQVEVSEEVFPDAMRKLVELEKNIEKKLEQVLGLRARVKLVEPRTIERTAGKAKRVIDKRVL